VDAHPVQYVRTTDGFRIAYITFGDGPPLVWMNAIPLAQNAQFLRSWPGVKGAIDFVAEHHTVVLFDSRGCGMSERRTGWLTLDGLMLDLEAVVDRLQIETFDLFGWALGAAPLAISFAAHHPSRVRRLVLVSPIIRQTDLAGIPTTEGLGATLQHDWQLFSETIGLLAHGLRDDSALRWSEAIRASVDQTTARHYFAFLNTLDVSELLPQVHTPTLVIHLTGERFLTLDSSAEIAAEISDARLITFEGTSSLNPEIWAEAIVSFLGGGLVPSQKSDNGLPAGGLSSREVEVLRLIAAGKSNQKIADELVISLNTVRRHVSNIFTKTGAGNRAEAVSYAHRNSLV